MRRTTKIILGATLSLLLLSMAFVVYQAILGPVKMGENKITNSLDTIALRGSYKVIKFVNNNLGDSYPICSRLNVLPATASHKAGTFVLSKDLVASLSQRIVGDTLVVDFKHGDDTPKNRGIRSRSYNNTLVSFYIYVDTHLPLAICNHLDEMDIYLANSTYKSVDFISGSLLKIDSCQIESLKLSSRNYNTNIHLMDSKVNKLTLNYEESGGLNVQKSTIDELKVTAPSLSDITFVDAVCKKINWSGNKLKIPTSN